MENWRCGFEALFRYICINPNSAKQSIIDPLRHSSLLPRSPQTIYKQSNSNRSPDTTWPSRSSPPFRLLVVLCAPPAINRVPMLGAASGTVLVHTSLRHVDIMILKSRLPSPALPASKALIFHDGPRIFPPLLRTHLAHVKAAAARL